MSNDAGNDADEVIAAQKLLAYKKARQKAAAGKLADKPKKTPRIGTIAPRTETEKIWTEEFGSVTPLPDPTLRRKSNIITAAILHIHYNRPLTECARLTGVDHEYLLKIKKEDEWEQFVQNMMQVTRPSHLALIRHHDLTTIEAELERRKSTVNQLREKEEAIVRALPSMTPGSMAETSALGNIQKIRDLIDKCTGLKDYMAEQSNARRVAASAQIRHAIERQMRQEAEQKAPQATRGAVVDL